MRLAFRQLPTDAATAQGTATVPMVTPVPAGAEPTVIVPAGGRGAIYTVAQPSAFVTQEPRRAHARLRRPDRLTDRPTD